MDYLKITAVGLKQIKIDFMQINAFLHGMQTQST